MQANDYQNNVFVEVKPNPKEQVVEFTYGALTLYNESPSGGFSCFVPGFNVYFSANSIDMVDKKTKVLVGFYFDHFMKHAQKQGFKKLILDLHKKGFKANNDTTTVHKLINNNIIPAKFKAPDFDFGRDYKSSSMINQGTKFAMAEM